MPVNRGVLQRAKKIKLVAMDVDGVLTGGEIIILNSGEEIKIWSVKDRMGFALLKYSQLPIKLAWVTARESKQVELRAKEIGVHFLHQLCLDKLEALRQMAGNMGITMDKIAYIGDDLVDLKCLKSAGLAICPPESPDLLKKVCHYETKTSSGKGVFREAIEMIIKAQNGWKQATAKFLLLALMLSFSLSACYSPPKNPDLTEKPDQWVEQFTITETLSGVPVWVLNSGNAQVFNKKRKVLLENIRIQFMNGSQIKKKPKESLVLLKKSLKQSALLTAPKGEVKLDSHDLAVWDGVEVQSYDGTKLFSERLTYSTSQQKITTESPIKIVRGNSILIGEGLEASPDLSTVRIFRHQASIYPKEVPLQK